MNRNTHDRMICRPNITFHVDYVAGLEYRKDNCLWIYLKNSQYMQQKMTQEESESVHDEFMKLVSEPEPIVKGVNNE